MKTLRFWAVVLMLATTAAILYSRPAKDLHPPAETLDRFPAQIGPQPGAQIGAQPGAQPGTQPGAWTGPWTGPWTGIDQPIDQESRDVLGAGDFLSRLYTQPAGLSAQTSAPAPPPMVGLFIAYFPSQRTGTTIHSPKHCLPGAGWTFESARTVPLDEPNGRSRQVGEYIIANGEQKQFVIYWYEGHGRGVADEYRAKFYMVADAIRMNRTDGALVRVMTPIRAADGVDAARARAETFTRLLLPLLPRFIPD